MFLINKSASGATQVRSPPLFFQLVEENKALALETLVRAGLTQKKLSPLLLNKPKTRAP